MAEKATAREPEGNEDLSKATAQAEANEIKVKGRNRKRKQKKKARGQKVEENTGESDSSTTVYQTASSGSSLEDSGSEREEQNLARSLNVKGNMLMNPSAGYTREKPLEAEETEGKRTFAGLEVKIENGKVKQKWPALLTAIKADVQRLELTETLANFIDDPDKRR